MDINFRSGQTCYTLVFLFFCFFLHISISVKANSADFRAEFMHVNKQGRTWGLTAVRWFTLGGEDDEAKTLIVSAVQRNIKRLVVESAGHGKPR